MLTSTIRYVRIIAPAHRAKERASVDEVQAGDTIEIPDVAIRRVDPVTRQVTNEFQQFVVGKNGTLAAPCGYPI